jgi:hypothetical protein
MKKKDKKQVSGNIKVWPSNPTFAAFNRKNKLNCENKDTTLLPSKLPYYPFFQI